MIVYKIRRISDGKFLQPRYNPHDNEKFHEDWITARYYDSEKSARKALRTLNKQSKNWGANQKELDDLEVVELTVEIVDIISKGA